MKLSKGNATSQFVTWVTRHMVKMTKAKHLNMTKQSQQQGPGGAIPFVHMYNLNTGTMSVTCDN